MKLSRADLIILIILALSNILVISPWFYLYFILALASYYFFKNQRRWHMIKRVMAVGAFPAFCGLYGAIKQVEPMVCAIGILALLKYLEIQNIRDRLSYYTLVIVFICGSVLLSDQILYLAISIGSILYIFYQLAMVSGVRFQGLRLLKILVPSILFSTFIFLIVPQVKVGNIFKYVGDRSGQGGFSESVSPGDFKKIVEDDRLYLFAKYKKLPRRGYWRGMTYNYTDGRTWRQRGVRPRVVTVKGSAESDFIVRKVEGRRTPLFFLEGTQVVGHKNPLGIFENTYFDILPLKDNTSLYALNFIDKSDNRVSQRKPDKFSTQYPKKNISSRFTDFLEKVEGESTNDKLNSLIDNFRTLNLEYSLETEIDQGKDLSEFLFNYKRGYCIHFASSFALALRVLGIPANVVGGFYGGEINAKDKFVLVKGGNAHAWIEYWDGERWIEFDPVGSIVQASQMPRNDFARFSELEDQSDFALNSGIVGIIDDIKSFYYQLNFAFFEFDFERQLVLFERYKQRVSELRSQDYMKIVGLLILLSLLIYFIRLLTKYQRSLNYDEDFVQKLKKILSVERINHSGHLLEILVKHGVDRELANKYREAFIRQNYSSQEIPRSEYRELKKEILRSLNNSFKNHSRNH